MTRDCIRFAPMIGAREGELSPSDAKELAAHLAGCETCRAMAADAAAIDGMVAEALLRKANSRDFSTFADEVMARVAPASRGSGVPGTSRAERPGLLAWLRRHRAAAAATLVPVMAALAAIVYVRVISDQGPVAMLELSSEGEATTVLQTADGPVVLLQEDGGT